MKLVVYHGGRNALAIGERLEFIQQTGLVDAVVSGDAPVLGSSSSSVPYLIDVNSYTARVALRCVARRRPWILDTGDDPRRLARNLGKPHWKAEASGFVDRWLVRGAMAVVCRGIFHVPILAQMTSAPIYHAPDTVPDHLLDGETPLGDASCIGTFGSVGIPVDGDRAYGWEVIDTVAELAGTHRGVIVANGPGKCVLERRAVRMGVADAIEIFPGAPMEDLVSRLATVGFITSVQTNDSAGWVRTTGKLPISLAMGKFVVATAVGQAMVTLPREALVRCGGDRELSSEMARIIEKGIPRGWAETARALAECFRRSTVAAGLAEFLLRLP